MNERTATVITPPARAAAPPAATKTAIRTSRFHKGVHQATSDEVMASLRDDCMPGCSPISAELGVSLTLALVHHLDDLNETTVLRGRRGSTRAPVRCGTSTCASARPSR